jgi:tensin
MNDLMDATKKAVNQASSSDLMAASVQAAGTAWESSAAAVGASLNAIPGQGRPMDLTYIADRLIAMGFPGRFPHNPIDGMAQSLHGAHPGRFMIWNISEESYDYGKFDGQVMQHQCPGYPAPPLGMLFSICRSMENWLNADAENVAVVHCWTGKGRTNTVLSCFLAWVGAFSSPQHALQHLCEVRDMKMDQAVIASQNRTLVCFQRMMQGVQPKMDSLRLLRVICTSVPVFEKQRMRSKHAPAATGNTPVKDGESRIIGGCRPCLQMWRIGEKQLTYNSVRDGGGKNIEAPEGAKMFMPNFVSEDDGSFSFTVDKKFQGDIMLRLLHLAAQPAQAKGGAAAAPKGKKQVAIMARGTFHTGYVYE